MYDFIKGIMLICVVLGHTIGLYPNAQENVISVELIETVAAVGTAILVPAFFIISGYGFRSQNFSKFIKNVASYYLKVYLLVAVVTLILNLIVHFAMFRYLPGAIYETKQLTLGFLLALPKNRAFTNWTAYAIGPIWFFVAQLVGWAILTIIYDKVATKYISFAVTIVVAVGSLMAYLNIDYFCISQGMIATGFLYVGFQLKKKHFFYGLWNYRYTLISLASLSILSVSIYTHKQVDNMANSIWNIPFGGVILDGVLAVGFLWLFVKCLDSSGAVGRSIAYIGRYSLYFLCVHNIEMLVVPWYRFQNDMRSNLWITIAFICIVRISVISIACKGLVYVGKKKKRVG